MMLKIMSVKNSLFTALLCGAMTISAFAYNVYPVIVESGNSGNYNNITSSMIATVNNFGGCIPGMSYAGDQNVSCVVDVFPVDGVATNDENVATAHVSAGWVSGDLYLFVSMQTDSGIGIRHALGQGRYCIKSMTFTAPNAGFPGTMPAAEQTAITNYVNTSRLPINTAASEVGAGTILNIQNLFINGTIRDNGSIIPLPAKFQDAAKPTSTKTLADIGQLVNYLELASGAQPVIVIMKLHSASQQSLNPDNPDDAVKIGLDNMTNITSNELSKIFSGQYRYWKEVGSFQLALRKVVTTTQFNAVMNDQTPVIIAPFLREPPSGTYNTFDECVMRGKGRLQEYIFDAPASGLPGRGLTAGVTNHITGQLEDGSTVAGSPASNKGPYAKYGGRVAGDGRMITSVKNVDYSIGYSFYDQGKFGLNTPQTDDSSKIDGSTVHYIMVDGVDPINAIANFGNPKSATPSFATVGDSFGAYPIWSNVIIAFRQEIASDPMIACFFNQYSLATGSFLPVNLNPWTRSHRRNAITVTPSNNPPAGTEEGGEILLKWRDDQRGNRDLGPWTGFHQP